MKPFAARGWETFNHFVYSPVKTFHAGGNPIIWWPNPPTDPNRSEKVNPTVFHFPRWISFLSPLPPNWFIKAVNHQRPSNNTRSRFLINCTTATWNIRPIWQRCNRFQLFPIDCFCSIFFQFNFQYDYNSTIENYYWFNSLFHFIGHFVVVNVSIQSTTTISKFKN